MTRCVKTGAYIYLDAYGTWSPADIYTVNPDTVVIRLNPEEHWVYTPDRPTTHHLYWPSADTEYFWASDKRTMVVPSRYLKDARHV